MTKIPVVFVIFQTGTSANGGVESMTQIIESLQTINPLVITQIETPVNQRWQAAGAKVEVWPISYKLGSFFSQDSPQTKLARIKSHLETNYRMYQLIKANPEYKIVHVNDIPAFRHTGFGVKLASAKLILNIRDVKPPQAKYGLQWQLAVKQSDLQLVLSREMGDAIAQRLGISSQNQDKIQQIYSLVDFAKMHPVDAEVKQTLRKRLKIPEDIFAIGYVATFNEKKAQLKFIEQAAPSLKKAIPQSICYFLGDFEPQKNPYAAQCETATQTQNLSQNLRFVGYNPNIAEWYQALDLVIIPTRNEGLARCMIESLACGTPVISFDLCSAKEILEEYNCGLVVPQGNYEALVEKILFLAQNQTSRLILGQNGSSAASKLFAAKAIIQQYEKLYKSEYFPSR